MAFEYLYNLSGKPVPVLSHTHSKKVFPYVWTEPTVFQFVPLPLVLAVDRTVLVYLQTIE